MDAILAALNQAPLLFWELQHLDEIITFFSRLNNYESMSIQAFRIGLKIKGGTNYTISLGKIEPWALKQGYQIHNPNRKWNM